MARGDSRFERPAGRVMAVGNPAVRTPPLPAFGAHARKPTIGKTSKISIFQRKTGRWIVDWQDEHRARRNPSFATLKQAEAFQKQKREE
jgi:hypothetical protein